MAFREKVAILLRKNNLSQNELSRRSGVSQSILSEVLKKESEVDPVGTKARKGVTLSTGLKIARALNVSLDWLANDEAADDLVPDWSAIQYLGERDRLALTLLEEFGVDDATPILFALLAYKDSLSGSRYTSGSHMRKAFLKMGYSDPHETRHEGSISGGETVTRDGEQGPEEEKRSG